MWAKSCVWLRSKGGGHGKPLANLEFEMKSCPVILHIFMLLAVCNHCFLKILRDGVTGVYLRGVL